LWPGHQRPAKRNHLLFTARGVAGQAFAPQLESRKLAVDTFQVSLELPTGRLTRKGARQQVFLHGQLGKTMPAFQHLHQSAGHQAMGRTARDILASI
jgi:hypothetical protein